MYKDLKYFVTQKIFTKLSELWFWDQGFKIWDPEKTLPESRIQGSKSDESLIRIATLFSRIRVKLIFDAVYYNQYTLFTLLHTYP
jgi:hypothetical protein